MVFQPDLGYNPDEWEECEDRPIFIVVNPFTRTLLFILAVGFTVLFFWITTVRKSRTKNEKTLNESKTEANDEKRRELWRDEVENVKWERLEQLKKMQTWETEMHEMKPSKLEVGTGKRSNEDVKYENKIVFRKYSNSQKQSHLLISTTTLATPPSTPDVKNSSQTKNAKSSKTVDSCDESFQQLAHDLQSKLEFQISDLDRRHRELEDIEGEINDSIPETIDELSSVARSSDNQLNEVEKCLLETTEAEKKLTKNEHQRLSLDYHQSIDTDIDTLIEFSSDPTNQVEEMSQVEQGGENNSFFVQQDDIDSIEKIQHLNRSLDIDMETRKVRKSPSLQSDHSNDSTETIQSSLMSTLGVTSLQELLLRLTNLDDLSQAMRNAGLRSSNLIFGIDYTASNKYQGERSFNGLSLHSIEESLQNPYQQVIEIMGKTLAPFATSGHIAAYGFGDATTSDWSVFRLKQQGEECIDFFEVLRVYNEITPTVHLSGPTNFAPLIHQAVDICRKTNDVLYMEITYHILVIVADGQVTNERATRRAIVDACHHPLSIIVVGVGDGPWVMMKVHGEMSLRCTMLMLQLFDDSLPKRSWDNFHFVEFHRIVETAVIDPNLTFAVQSLLEIPDQYRHICQLGLIKP